MSEFLTRHHALEGFLTLPETNTTESKPVKVDILTNIQHVNIRGDSDNDVFLQAVKSVFGVSLPVIANTVVRDAHTIYWMGPDEWLVQSYESAAGLIEKFRDQETARGSTAVDVSDGSVMFRISGERAVDVLARGCTLDLHPQKFSNGQCAQTAIARTSVLLTSSAGDSAFEIVVRRTFAEYLALWLRHAAAEFGVKFSAIE